MAGGEHIAPSTLALTTTTCGMHPSGWIVLDAAASVPTTVQIHGHYTFETLLRSSRPTSQLHSTDRDPGRYRNLQSAIMCRHSARRNLTMSPGPLKPVARQRSYKFAPRSCHVGAVRSGGLLALGPDLLRRMATIRTSNTARGCFAQSSTSSIRIPRCRFRSHSKTNSYLLRADHLPRLTAQCGHRQLRSVSSFERHLQLPRALEGAGESQRSGMACVLIAFR